MKDSADKYFELLPVLLVALIMLAAEYRQLTPSTVMRFERSLYEAPLVAPRLIFR